MLPASKEYHFNRYCAITYLLSLNYIIYIIYEYFYRINVYFVDCETMEGETHRKIKLNKKGDRQYSAAGPPF
jgi:hypothetical protein